MNNKEVLSIAVDIGNTNVCIGLFKGNTFVDKLNHSTKLTCLSFDEAELIFTDFFNKHKEFKHSEGALISSVVPSLTNILKEFIDQIANVNSKVLDYDLFKDVPMKIDNPKEVGGDLIAAIVGAKEYYKTPCVIADLGTVSKFLVIDKDGYFVGASFSPGLKSSFDAMNGNTALLPSMEEAGASINNNEPPSLYGKNTVECMKSGIYWSCVYSVETMMIKIKESLGSDAALILTGGYSTFVRKGLQNDKIILDGDLVLKGINHLYLKSR